MSGSGFLGAAGVFAIAVLGWAGAHHAIRQGELRRVLYAQSLIPWSYVPMLAPVLAVAELVLAVTFGAGVAANRDGLTVGALVGSVVLYVAFSAYLGALVADGFSGECGCALGSSRVGVGAVMRAGLLALCSIAGLAAGAPHAGAIGGGVSAAILLIALTQVAPKPSRRSEGAHVVT